MGTLNETTMRAVFTILALAVCLSFASDVEDLGVQPINNKASLGEATKTRDQEDEGNFGGALMTSGSFTMMAAGGGFEEERDELGEANDWDITNGGQCDESEEAWVMTDAKDTTMGKCVKFAADNKCSAQCFHQGKSVDESVDGAVCTKICRVPGAAGAQCNVIKMVMPQESTNDLGEGKTMYLTRSKVMQAGLKGKDLGEADPMACAGVATNRK